MRAVVGFIALNGWVLAVGAGVLRALGLLAPGRRGPAAVGPAFVTGIGVLGPLLCVALVVGIPLTIPVLALAGGLVLVACVTLVRRRTPSRDVASGEPAGGAVRWGRRALFSLAGLYALYVAYVFARAPTRGDDARIWSIRGLTLAYYHGLQPEIFLNPGQSGAHPVYPLLQPIVEALLSEALGAPQLRLYHTEIWLLVAAAVWTAGFLIARRAPAPGRRAPVWLGVLVLLALTPITFRNVYIGDADVAGSVMLALGGLAVALWLESGDHGCLAFGAVMLAASASTKDEDFIGAVVVLLVTGAFLAVRHRARLTRAWPWLAAVAWFGVFVLPWRLWLSAHHLSDTVQPPLPKALSPVYIIDQHHLGRVTAFLLSQVFEQWGWLAAIFLATCAVCLVTGAGRRITAFYLAAVGVIAVMIIWLYTTTPLSLDFLLPTSMDRTVGVFMVLAALATAHLLAVLTARDTRA